MKLSKKEIEEAYLARLASETRQPENEEQRRKAKENLRKKGGYSDKATPF